MGSAKLSTTQTGSFNNINKKRKHYPRFINFIKALPEEKRQTRIRREMIQPEYNAIYDR